MRTEISHANQNSIITAILSVRVIHSDDAIVVIDKPCDLRSVPGHANPPPSSLDKQKSDSFGSADDPDIASAGIFDENKGHDYLPPPLQSQRRTAQEAWIDAIKSFTASINDHKSNAPSGDCLVEELLRNLGTTADPSSVPRKLDTFIRYCNRNCRRLFPSLFVREYSVEQNSGNSDNSGSTKVEGHISKKLKIKENRIDIERNVLKTAYVILQQTQRPLMNLAKPTEDWESALGQLRLLGFGDFAHYNLCDPSSTSNSPKSNSDIEKAKNCYGVGNVQEQVNNKLHVIHRLDCQVKSESKLNFFIFFLQTSLVIAAIILLTP